MNPLSELWEKIRTAFAGYPDWVSEGVVAAFLGLVIGFLARILGRLVLMTLVTAVLIGFGLHYFGIISFHIQPLLKFLGLTQWPGFSELLSSFFTACKAHLMACVTLILGFILGWQLGR